MRRTLIAVSALSVLTAAGFVVPGLANAVDGTGVYGAWTASGGSGVVSFPGTQMPSATFTSVDSTQTVATSQTMNGATPFGLQYGTSRGKQYLLTAVASGQSTGSVTLTFATPPVAGTWGFALGDVDAEDVTVNAKDANGRAVNVDEFFVESFNNTAGQSDMPTWNPATETLEGSGVDTTGASAWFTPSSEITSITLTQKKLSGFPQYALWIATDTELPPTAVSSSAVASSASASSASASSASASSASASASPTASPTIPSAATGKVVICHRTSSDKNPYVRIEISQSAVLDRNGHGSHDGGLYPTKGWGDIIPPFTGFAGQNWPVGGAILDNDCDIPAALTAASASASASASTTASSTASASASASASTSASSSSSDSASASSSASGTASPSATAEVSTLSTPTSTPTPLPTETAAPVPSDRAVPGGPDVIVEPGVPAVLDVPDVPSDSTVTDVTPPEHGTAVIEDGKVIYTPDEGFIGKDTVVVTVTDRDGTASQISVEVGVGTEQVATNLSLPTSLTMGTTVLIKAPVRTNAGQIATVKVSCTPLARMALRGGAGQSYCYTETLGGKVTLTAPNQVKVVVIASAPAKGQYLAYREVKAYRIK